MAGGKEAGEAVSLLLLAAAPATPDVVQSWDRGGGRPASRAAAGPREDEVYAALSPDRPGQPGGQARAAGVAPLPPGYGGDLTAEDLAPEPPGHDSTTVVHDHSHSVYDGSGAQHSHLHEHIGDASHEPGRSAHQHGTHSDTAASAGGLGELYDKLFGPPPGSGG
jgi:hypothetical protein